MTEPKDPGPAARRAAESGNALLGAKGPGVGATRPPGLGALPPVPRFKTPEEIAEGDLEVMEQVAGLPPSGQPVFRASRGTNRHWLVLPETVRGIWIVALLGLAAAVAAEFAVDYHLKFYADEIPGFAAIFGLAACVALVLGSKLLGVFLKRGDDYYDD